MHANSDIQTSAQLGFEDSRHLQIGSQALCRTITGDDAWSTGHIARLTVAWTVVKTRWAAL